MEGERSQEDKPSDEEQVPLRSPVQHESPPAVPAPAPVSGGWRRKGHAASSRGAEGSQGAGAASPQPPQPQREENAAEQPDVSAAAASAPPAAAAADAEQVHDTGAATVLGAETQLPSSEHVDAAMAAVGLLAADFPGTQYSPPADMGPLQMQPEPLQATGVLSLHEGHMQQ